MTKLTEQEIRDECATEITMALINRIPDVHAIYAEAIKREVLRELNKSKLLNERETLLKDNARLRQRLRSIWMIAADYCEAHHMDAGD